MKNCNDKDGMIMIFRAIIITLVALMASFLIHKYYLTKPLRKQVDIYMDEDGCYYDVTCLEQKAFARLMLIKMKNKPIEREIR